MDLYIAMGVFNQVARLKSFSAAAADLGMSKTAVSRHVSDLESSLGVRLINRTTRRMSLTEAGKAYAGRSSAILAEIEELQSATQDLHRNPRGLLRVTAGIAFGHHCLVPTVAPFLVDNPDVSLQLELTNRLVDIVEEGYDLAIRMGELSDSSLISRKLTSSNVYICAAQDYLQRNGEPATPEDLAEHRCITVSGQRDESLWQLSRGERTSAVSVSARLQVNSAEAAARMMRDGLGIALLPDFIVDKDLASGNVQRLLKPYDLKDDGIYAVYPHKHHLSAKVRVFIDHLAMSLGGGPR
ncbi:MAG: LysR family transcriptional regulator [Pseudomonadota bacterium]